MWLKWKGEMECTHDARYGLPAARWRQRERGELVVVAGRQRMGAW